MRRRRSRCSPGGRLHSRPVDSQSRGQNTAPECRPASAHTRLDGSSFAWCAYCRSGRAAKPGSGPFCCRARQAEERRLIKLRQPWGGVDCSKMPGKRRIARASANISPLQFRPVQGFQTRCWELPITVNQGIIGQWVNSYLPNSSCQNRFVRHLNASNGNFAL